MIQLLSLLLCVPNLKCDHRLQSPDFSFVSFLSALQDATAFPASDILAYAFVLTGLVGLALSYALSVTNLLSGLISSFTHTEIMMVSVERTEEYTTDIPMEPRDKLVQVKAQMCSQVLAHLLALCPALVLWGDHRVPVNGWRALTTETTLVTHLLPVYLLGRMNLWQEPVKAGVIGGNREAEWMLDTSCDGRTSLGVGWRWDWAVCWFCSEARQSSKGRDGAWTVGR